MNYNLIDWWCILIGWWYFVCLLDGLILGICYNNLAWKPVNWKSDRLSPLYRLTKCGSHPNILIYTTLYIPPYIYHPIYTTLYTFKGIPRLWLLLSLRYSNDDITTMFKANRKAPTNIFKIFFLKLRCGTY